jgi:WXG100 family type VII secretion target
MSEGASGGQDDLRVQESDITNCIKNLDSAIESLRGDHNSLTAMQSDLTGGWRGAAAAQFNTGQSDTNVNLDRLIQSLQNLRELVQMSRDGFSQEEDERVAELRTASAGLQEMNPAILGLAQQ